MLVNLKHTKVDLLIYNKHYFPNTFVYKSMFFELKCMELLRIHLAGATIAALRGLCQVLCFDLKTLVGFLDLKNVQLLKHLFSVSSEIKLQLLLTAAFKSKVKFLTQL